MAGRVVAALAGLTLASGIHGSPALPPGFHQIASGPDGGVVVQGWIRNPVEPRFFRPTVVYLPPGYDPGVAIQSCTCSRASRARPTSMSTASTYRPTLTRASLPARSRRSSP
jgi:hypothetical protein